MNLFVQICFYLSHGAGKSTLMRIVAGVGSALLFRKAARIEKSILLIRGEKVIIDADLASFYGVSTKRLNEQVKRNRNRFPAIAFI